MSEIVRDPDTLGGTPVFRGTRVPVKALFDCLVAGDPLETFLDDFPTVSADQARAVIREAEQRVELVA